MALEMTTEHIEAIRRHGASDYPNECCGILLGRERDGTKEVREVKRVANLRRNAALAEKVLPLDHPDRESERNRFLIDWDEVRRVEREARDCGLEIVGTYHSHPDHPARPSDYDREHAWPWLSYVIIKIEAGTPGDYASWILSEDRTYFENEPVKVVSGKRPATAS